MKKKKLLLASAIVLIISISVGIATAALPDCELLNPMPKLPKVKGTPLSLDKSAVINIKEPNKYEGNLVLVNYKYSLDKNFVPPDLINIYEKRTEDKVSFPIMNVDIEVSERLYHACNELLKIAHENGEKKFVVNSGYRSFDEQQYMFDNQTAKERYKKIVSNAGHSEHQLGLSVDIGNTGRYTRAFCWKAGLILRYKKDKRDVTRIAYEPWHYRYVGRPHAEIIMKENLALEEYPDWLKEKGIYRLNAEDGKYLLMYAFPEDGVIKAPEEFTGCTAEYCGDGVVLTKKIE